LIGLISSNNMNKSQVRKFLNLRNFVLPSDFYDRGMGNNLQFLDEDTLNKVFKRILFHSFNLKDTSKLFKYLVDTYPKFDLVKYLNNNEEFLYSIIRLYLNSVLTMKYEHEYLRTLVDMGVSFGFYTKQSLITNVFTEDNCRNIVKDSLLDKVIDNLLSVQKHSFSNNYKFLRTEKEDEVLLESHEFCLKNDVEYSTKNVQMMFPKLPRELVSLITYYF